METKTQPLANRNTPDWWVCVDGKVLAERQSLRQIDAILQKQPDSAVAILNVNSSDRRDWKLVNTQSLRNPFSKARREVKAAIHESKQKERQRGATQPPLSLRPAQPQEDPKDKMIRDLQHDARQLRAEVQNLRDELKGLIQPLAVDRAVLREREKIHELSKRAFANNKRAHDEETKELLERRKRIKEREQLLAEAKRRWKQPAA